MFNACSSVMTSHECQSFGIERLLSGQAVRRKPFRRWGTSSWGGALVEIAQNRVCLSVCLSAHVRVCGSCSPIKSQRTRLLQEWIGEQMLSSLAKCAQYVHSVLPPFVEDS